MGSSTPLSAIMEDTDTCSQILALGETTANSECTGPSIEIPWEYPVCNWTWHTARMKHFCEDNRWLDYTIGDAAAFNRWGSYPAGSQLDMIGRSWNHAKNMESVRNSNLHLYVLNGITDKDAYGFQHNPLFAAAYAKIAQSLGLPFVVYYGDWINMDLTYKTEESYIAQNPSAYPAMHSTCNYLSSIDWRAQVEAKGLNMNVGSDEELVAFACHALDLECHF